MAMATLLWGCASPPRQELQAARMAVARAYAAGAQQLAPGEYQAASDTLGEGEELVRRGQYKLAREVLPFAESRALQAILKTQEEQTIRELQKMQEMQEQQELQQPEEMTAREETARLPTAPTKQAITAASLRPPLKPTPPPPPPPPLSRYTVGEGETLWTIATRREVYSDPLLWTLLYRANRDQIKDPRHIYPGQVLTIPRNVSAADLAEAREKANSSDIFPVEQLLRQSPRRGR